jgi:hypothetical protein
MLAAIAPQVNYFFASYENFIVAASGFHYVVQEFLVSNLPLLAISY